MSESSVKLQLAVRVADQVDYQTAWEAMRRFNEERTADSVDEIWLLEHPPVYTLGLNNKAALPPDNRIPVVATDRGGQITYHGPGQLILYTLLDLQRLGIGIKRLVELLEDSVIALLAHYGVNGHRKQGAPGVYVDNKKVSALGLRVRRNGSYHGLSLNVDMDLSPFSRIDPCGYEGMEVTDLRTLGITADSREIEDFLLTYLGDKLGYTVPSRPFHAELP